jgi:hypothetical protein
MSKSDHKDKQIQEQLLFGLEAGSASIDDSELSAYQTVFDTLNQKPSGGLPYKFSSSVIGEIQRRQVAKNQFKAQLLVPVFIAIGFFFCYLGLHKADPSYGETLLQSAMTYKWFIIFGLAVFFLVEFLDFKFVKKEYKEVSLNRSPL